MTTATPTTPEQAFLDAICDAPEDDAPRLMFADWLEERGDVRGEFIRVQCESHRAYPQYKTGLTVDGRTRRLIERGRELLEAINAEGMTNRADWLGRLCNEVIPEQERAKAAELSMANLLAAYPIISAIVDAEFRRGFVEAVTLRTEDWIGQPCPNSGPACYYHNKYGCSVCHGTRRVNAYGLKLVRVAPLTSVRLVDREPGLCDDGRFSWYFGHMRQYLPWILRPYFPAGDESLYYSTRDAALDALSTAALAWARSEAARAAP